MGAATAVAALVLALAGGPAAGVRIQLEAAPTIQAKYTVTPELKLEFVQVLPGHLAAADGWLAAPASRPFRPAPFRAPGTEGTYRGRRAR